MLGNDKIIENNGYQMKKNCINEYEERPAAERSTLLHVVRFAKCILVGLIVIWLFGDDWSVGFKLMIGIVVPGLIVWWGIEARDHGSGIRKYIKKEWPSSGESNREWIPKGKTAEVAGRDVGGMVYVGKPPLVDGRGYREKCRAYIDRSCRVAPRARDKNGLDLPYWPSYSNIPPKCRATYLDWLATGRSDKSYNPGYLFLYFYGLERRYFFSKNEDDRDDIIEETKRLLSLYQENRSVKRYLGEFIDVAETIGRNIEAIKPVPEQQGWGLPFSLKYAIGVRLSKKENLSADWLLSWLLCHPDCILRTPAVRCRNEFIALFHIRFNARYPNGMAVNVGKKFLVGKYEAASGEFEWAEQIEYEGKKIPDISSLKKPITIAMEIAEEITKDLDKLSRFIGRNPNGGNSIEAHALLPKELWFLFPSSEMEQIRSWAKKVVTDGGLVQLDETLEMLEGKSSSKLSKKQLVSAADALARLGFGLAPDPRYALRSAKLGEPVVIFDLGAEVEELGEVSLKYRKSLLDIAVSTFVFYADGKITELEKRALEDKVKSVSGLNGHEANRLSANLKWLCEVPPDITLLRRKLKECDNNIQEMIRASLVSIAHVEGIPQTEEIASMEKLYKAIGIDPSLAYTDVHSAKIYKSQVHDGETDLRSCDDKLGREGVRDEGRLNRARIAAIRTDSERVSDVLGGIFGEEESQENIGSMAEHSPIPGLDKMHAGLLLSLIQENHWSHDAFDQLCADNSLLPSGALETLNEWAYETYGDSVIEEYERYDLSPEIIEHLKKQEAVAERCQN